MSYALHVIIDFCRAFNGNRGEMTSSTRCVEVLNDAVRFAPMYYPSSSTFHCAEGDKGNEGAEDTVDTDSD
jgi:hypothetical protein